MCIVSFVSIYEVIMAQAVDQVAQTVDKRVVACSPKKEENKSNTEEAATKKKKKTVSLTDMFSRTKECLESNAGTFCFLSVCLCLLVAFAFVSIL